MAPIVTDQLPGIAAVCKRYGVQRLDLFGSATGHALRAFDPERSDLDFLVRFNELPHIRPADQYFGLMEALEALLGRKVDLIDDEAIRNPYFRQVVESEREPVYVARGEEAVDGQGAVVARARSSVSG